jgi:NAD(P)-dependent dehydrogenase (short-subunit alcohol dehydrogenase family)
MGDRLSDSPLEPAPFVLTGRRTVVIGAGSGIGRGTACTLADLGATVVVADIDKAAAGETLGLIESSGGQGKSRALDVTDPDATRTLIDEVSDDLGGLDILVNSVGVTRSIDFLDITPADWDWIERINLRGMFFATQAAGKRMAAQGGGRIVNISSISGKGHRLATNPVYASTKGAVITLGRVAASRLGASNVTVNTVCPGLTLTPMTERLYRTRAQEQGRDFDDLIAERATPTALGRINTVDDIALAVAFLVSPAARNITGQSLNVDAGLVWD